jgi:hypothetical protein
MALSGAGLKSMVQAQLQSQLGTDYVSNPINDKVLTALCNGIILYLVANTTVTTTVTGVASVTSAPGAAPVTGSGTGQIS